MEAQTILKQLSPEERVGQLFLVTFKGTDVGESSQIYDLITNHFVGGVVLSAANDNFSNVASSNASTNTTATPSTPSSPGSAAQGAYNLVSQIQSVNWQASQVGPSNKSLGLAGPREYIPMFVGTSQEGDGYPNDQILSGMTPLPDLMAIGATWEPKMAEDVGAVMGRELAAMGFNLYLGPSLDVLDPLQSGAGIDLGTRTFGENPYWVGQMGQSYISGLHAGSDGRLAVIAKDFPGEGSADRPPDQEVATVSKTLDQLKQDELAPFYAVTGNAPNPQAATDGVLVAHIRYQGLQGNIGPTTRPVSFDPAALSLLMNMSQFATWRSGGGLVISDDLGSRAVRRFYDPLGQSFDSRQVARNAFLAGNDLLYVDNFTASGDPDSYTSIVRTLDFFAQKYRDDSTFAQRVDASVLRILEMKLKLYKTFSLSQVTPPASGMDQVGQSQQVVDEVARQAGTLISPDVKDLDSALPRPPGSIDRMVFFTDVLPYRQCSTCTEQNAMPADEMENAILRLYGPQAGGQVYQNRMSSYSFTDLTNMLNGTEDSQTVENDIRTADWIIVSMLNVTNDRPDSSAFQRLLSQRPDLLTNKRVIVFAFNAPYYLDATDISKITAYYGLYSKTPAFIDAAARILFQEQTPKGALPASVPGAGYVLSQAIQPDPSQVISLYLDTPETPSPSGTPTLLPAPSLAPTAVPTFKVGDTLPLRTGVITDQNGNPVTDNTPVDFTFTTTVDVGGTQSTDVVVFTVQGVARTTYHIDNAGLLEIRASSGPATSSDILRLDIKAGTGAAITAIAPTPVPTETPAPTLTPAATILPTALPAAGDLGRPIFGEWILAMLVIAAGAALAYTTGNWWVSLRWGVRWGLCTVLGGLLAYSYLALGMPGGSSWLESVGMLGVLEVTLLGAGLGWGSGLIWRSWAEQVKRAK